MKKSKGSEFIYCLDLEHVNGRFGVWDFKTFYTRSEALDFAESLAKNNPDMSVSIQIRPRFRKRIALTAS